MTSPVWPHLIAFDDVGLMKDFHGVDLLAVLLAHEEHLTKGALANDQQHLAAENTRKATRTGSLCEQRGGRSDPAPPMRFFFTLNESSATRAVPLRCCSPLCCSASRVPPPPALPPAEVGTGAPVTAPAGTGLAPPGAPPPSRLWMEPT